MLMQNTLNKVQQCFEAKFGIHLLNGEFQEWNGFSEEFKNLRLTTLVKTTTDIARKYSGIFQHNGLYPYGAKNFVI